MKNLLTIIAVTLLFVACNKNQSAIKKLDGTWAATELVETDLETGLSYDRIALGETFKLTFSNCKLKDDEWCNSNSISTLDELIFTANLLYNVQNKGKQLITKVTPTGEISDTYTIVELTKSRLVLTETDDGYRTDMVFIKE